MNTLPKRFAGLGGSLQSQGEGGDPRDDRGVRVGDPQQREGAYFRDLRNFSPPLALPTHVDFVPAEPAAADNVFCMHETKKTPRREPQRVRSSFFRRGDRWSAGSATTRVAPVS